MKSLILEIWKLKYLYHICRNPAVSNEQYDKLMEELENLETQYPALVHRSTTPTDYPNFNEARASRAYGEDWELLKRTWDLLKVEPEYWG